MIKRINNALTPIIVSIIFFLIIMSIMALFAIFWKLFKLDFDFSPEGMDVFLNSFSVYKFIFTGTIIVTTSYLGLLRVKSLTDANIDKNKQEYFNE